MRPKLLVRAKVNNGSSLPSDVKSVESSFRCICNVNSYNFLDRTNNFCILCFILLLLLVLDEEDDDDTVDANDKACKCKVNAKLYMTIMRNLDNNSDEYWDDSSITMGSRKTKCRSFRDRLVEGTVSGDDDDDDANDDDVLDGVVVVVVSLSLVFFVSIDLFWKLIVIGTVLLSVSESVLSCALVVLLLSLPPPSTADLSPSTSSANGFNIFNTAVNDFTAES